MDRGVGDFVWTPNIVAVWNTQGISGLFLCVERME